MKNTILLLLLLAAHLAAAQSIDTVYFEPYGNIFRKVHIRGDLNGRIVTISEPADSGQVKAYALEKIRHEATERANAARIAAEQKTSGQIAGLDANLQSLLGYNPADTIANEVFLKKLAGKTLQWVQDGNTANAEITPGDKKGAAYNLTIGKNATYTIRLYNEGWLRVDDFPKQHLTTDLFLIKGAYRSKEGAYVLEDAGGGGLKPGKKSAAPASTKKKPAKKKRQ